MIMNYRELPELHRLCFNLQTAAAVALFMGEYTRLLDVTKPNQLLQFQLASFFMLLAYFWTRAIDWVYPMGKILLLFYAEEKWVFLAVGSIAFVLFSMFNVFLCLLPIYARFVKFMKKSAEYQALPKDANSMTRRSTVT